MTVTELLRYRQAWWDADHGWVIPTATGPQSAEAFGLLPPGTRLEDAPPPLRFTREPYSLS